MGLPRLHSLQIPSQLNKISSAIQKIMAAINRQGYDAQVDFAVRLVLEEAISNAVRHGNRLNPAKKVTIKYRISPDIIHLCIQDQGPGFHPDAVPDPTARENLERPGGRGVMLMRAYMDEVHFTPQGNCVTMVLKRKTKKS